MKIVLPKGRLLNNSLEVLNDSGFQLSITDTRELIVENEDHEILLAKPYDVPVYVEKGADIGITGRDVIEERQSEVFIPLKLPFGYCRMSLAVPKEKNVELKEMNGFRIATEYPDITKNFFKSKNIDVEIITLEGSTELAPRAGIADAIVDIVETGKTLEANDLKEINKIMDISALFLVNRISQKTKFDELNELVSKIKEVTKNESK